MLVEVALEDIFLYVRLIQVPFHSYDNKYLVLAEVLTFKKKAAGEGLRSEWYLTVFTSRWHVLRSSET
jgi:hypothetical protein